VSSPRRPIPVRTLAQGAVDVRPGDELVTSGFVRAVDDQMWLCSAPTPAEEACAGQGLVIAGGRLRGVDAEAVVQELGGRELVVAGVLAASESPLTLQVEEVLDGPSDEYVYGEAFNVEVAARVEVPSSEIALTADAYWPGVEPVVRGNTTAIELNVFADAGTQVERPEIHDLRVAGSTGGELVLNERECDAGASCSPGAVRINTARAQDGSYTFAVPVTWEDEQHSGDARLHVDITLKAVPGRQAPG